MSEERNFDDRNKLERFHQPDPRMDEISLIRPSGAAPISSMDQFAYNYYNAAPPEEGFNIREFWRKIRKRKWLVLVVAFIATTIVTVESYRNRSLYQATAKVARNNNGATAFKVGETIFQTDDSERIKTDLLLLRTTPLLAKVIVRLKLYEDPRFLESEQRKTVVEAVQTIVARFKSVGGQASEPQKFDPLPPQFDGNPSPEEIERLMPYIGALDRALYVSQIDETKAIQISFTHTEPAIASAVANTVSQVFVDESYANRTASVSSSTNWLDQTTRELEAQAQKAAAELAGYTSNNNIYSTDENRPLVSDKLLKLYGESVVAETDRKKKQSLYEEVKKGRVAQLPEIFSDAGTTQSQAKLAGLRVDLARLTATFGPENPKVQTVQSEIKELERQIEESTRKLEARLKADFERAQRDEELIKESVEVAKAEAKDQNQASIRFNLLKQNVDTTRGLYNDFLKQTNQAQIEKKQQQGNDLRVIEPARTPTSPTGPKRARAIIIGLLLSLAGGVGLALLLEYLDNTVKSIEDVTRATQLPTLALIPAINAVAMKAVGGKKNVKQKTIGGTRESSGPVGGLVPRGQQPPGDKLAALGALSSVVESYRMLRTSVLLSTAGSPPKTILFTSSQPGEGKTTTAVNTAISLSQLGASVLLIDADLRRPAVHKAFKIPHTRGISNYLSSHTPLENLIVRLPIPNLSVLPCGPIPPNPAELISSDRMKELLRILGQQYDHILIDSPPLISVTDPVILSTMVDGSILVVQAGKSTRELVRRARRELAGVNAKIFGVVLNNVNVKREGYDDYDYYRYTSSYNEGYRGAKVG